MNATVVPIEVSDFAKLPADPVVSVLMVAYNHEAYLADAIDGVLAQRTDYPFELLIGEDCSRDGTLRIALDFQSRHPEVIRVVYAEQNVGGDNNLWRIAERARGRYVAYCDGDDHWCHPEKLQRQVEIAESDRDIAAVHTDWVRARHVNGAWQVARRSEHAGVARKFLEGDLFRSFYFPQALRACTLMYRREALDLFLASPWGSKRYRFGDTVLAAFVTSRWRVGYVDAVTAVYRESAGSALRSGAKSKLLFLQSALEFDTDARRHFADRSDYPLAYRWEVAIGLLGRSLAMRDRETARFAIADLRAHYDIPGFFRAAWTAVLLRIGRLRGAAGSR